MRNESSLPTAAVIEQYVGPGGYSRLTPATRIPFMWSRREPAPGAGFLPGITIRYTGAPGTLVRVTGIRAYAGGQRPVMFTYNGAYIGTFADVVAGAGVGQSGGPRSTRTDTALPATVVGGAGTASQAQITAAVGIANDNPTMLDWFLSLADQNGNTTGAVLVQPTNIEIIGGGTHTLYIMNDTATGTLDATVYGEVITG